MLFARRQSADRGGDLLPRHTAGRFDCHSFDYFGEGRTASERRRTAIGEKPRTLNPTIANEQRQTQAITAHRIDALGGCVCVRYLTGIARRGEVVFESVGVSQKMVSLKSIRVTLSLKTKITGQRFKQGETMFSFASFASRLASFAVSSEI